MADSEIDDWEYDEFTEDLESASEDEIPRKRVAFTVPKDAATKSRIEHNSTRSPLLRLPLEVRLNIYGHLLGHRRIRVVRDSVNKRSRNRDGQSIVKRCSKWSTSIRPISPINHLRQKAKRSERSIHLKVLRTCRQLYNEGNQVLWTTNTFSFDDGNSFYHFCHSLRANQKNLLRNLRLTLDWDNQGGVGHWEPSSPASLWTSGLRVQILKSLKGVTHLQLKIYMTRSPDHWQQVKSRFGVIDPVGASDPGSFVRFASYLDSAFRSFEGVASRTPGEAAMKLSILPLADVSVDVRSNRNGIWLSDVYERHEQLNLGGVEEQQQFAGTIRDRLLAGGGLKGYNEGVKAWRVFLKEYRKKEKE